MKFQNPRLIGKIASIVMKSLRMTLSIQKIKHASFDPSKPVIYAFWHGQFLLPIMTVRSLFDHDVAGFISTSKDGDIVAKLMEDFGYEVVRGSTSKKAISGMIDLLKKARKGYSLGLAPDGPRGPRHEVSQGLMFLAAKSKLPIVPVGVYESRAKVFEKAWDKFRLPMPFSKAVVYFDEPYTIENLEKCQETILKQKLIDASKTAALWAEKSEQKSLNNIHPIKV